jgi:predicted transglutaminase-like cysteine proteinase
MNRFAARSFARLLPQWRRRKACLWLLPVVAASAVAAYDFDRLQQLLVARFGVGQVPLLQEWRRVLADAAGPKLNERQKLTRINDFFNRRVEFLEDQVIWAQSDYWATPLETIGQGRADCEDYAIIKYYSLKDAGISQNKLRLVYVKARIDGPGGPRLQAHMVLAYYPTPDAEPLVLDNLIPEIRTASQRKDLHPVFSFTSEAIWSGVAGDAAKGRGGTGQLSRWEDLLNRARSEGFE